MGFMFAPAHHSAMRYAIGPRRELGMRTVFNILGPLTNPAGVKRQVIGVFSADLCQPLAEVLKVLGTEHAMIVHSDDGLDEISIAAGTQVTELCDGNIESYHITPEDFSLQRQSLDGLSVNSAAASADLIRRALAGADDEPAQKAAAMLALNAGATIYVSGIAATLADGVAMAEDALASGLAAEKLQAVYRFHAVDARAGLMRWPCSPPPFCARFWRARPRKWPSAAPRIPWPVWKVAFSEQGAPRGFCPGAAAARRRRRARGHRRDQEGLSQQGRDSRGFPARADRAELPARAAPAVSPC